MRLALVLLLACGGKPAPQPPGNGSGSAQPAFHDSRSEIEKRRDTACDQLATRNTACAVADAKADLAAGKVTQKQFDADTSPQVQQKNSEKFAEKCRKQALNSYQVRVYEVCMREEPDCGPLYQCLEHIHDPQK